MKKHKHHAEMSQVDILRAERAGQMLDEAAFFNRPPLRSPSGHLVDPPFLRDLMRHDGRGDLAAAPARD